MAAQTLGGKLKEFQTELNKISKKRENGKWQWQFEFTFFISSITFAHCTDMIL